MNTAGPLRVAAFDRLAQRHAVPGRNSKQLRSPPDEVALEFMHDAIGEHHLPQHLDDALASLLVERAAKHAGELVKIYRFHFTLIGLAEQLAEFVAVEVEA